MPIVAFGPLMAVSPWRQRDSEMHFPARHQRYAPTGGLGATITSPRSATGPGIDAQLLPQAAHILLTRLTSQDLP